MNRRGQFSIIAALLVAVVLIATVIVTYSAIRDSPVKDQPPVQSAIDETNFAIKQILGFTVGYYGSVLQVTGNSSYARMLAINYLHSGLVNIANMHAEWGASFNVSSSDLYTLWFTNASYSIGNLALKYNLTGLGVSGITYGVSCKLDVHIIDTISNQVYLNVTKDENEPLINLGKRNFKFYRYVNSSSTWEMASPSNEPVAYANGTYQIDVPTGVDPYSYVVQIEDQRGIEVVASSFSHYTCAMIWSRTQETKYAVVGNTSEALGAPDWQYATVQKGDTCDVTDYQSGTGLIKEVYFNITYYGSASGTLEWYYQLDGGLWNKIEDLPEGGSQLSPLTRTYNATNLRASWTWESLNSTSIRFKNNFNNDNAFVDAIYVTLAYNVAGNYSTIPNETIVVELLQNGTMCWLGQSLTSTTNAKPIPPIPIRSIHVNQTINNVDSEVPYQVEDWASEYRIPLGLTNNASVFSSKTMLVFLVTSKVSRITIWWNGSDAATQTPLAYTNRYFTGDNEASGVLTNGVLTLSFVGDFTVDSTVGGSTCNAKFMRINGKSSTYGSGKPAYVITKGIVRDVVHQEAEFGGGVDNCSNIYAHIVLTLPANATYYTYQLRVMFVQSQQNRTISELLPIRTVTYPSGQPQTENGTLNGYPIVSNATSVSFYNQSNQYWAHHWSQYISASKGSGIMYRDDTNSRLYSFDSIAGNKSGALNVTSTGERAIEFKPIAKTAVYNFTSSLDIIWSGAVVTFDGTTPIYKEENGLKTGLWIVVEYPPEVTISTGS